MIRLQNVEFGSHGFSLLRLCSKSSIILGLALSVPLMAASLAVALPLWVRNGFRFHKPPVVEVQPDGSQATQQKGILQHGEVFVMYSWQAGEASHLCLSVCFGKWR